MRKQFDLLVDLQEALHQVLVRGPLYRALLYDQQNCHVATPNGRASALPERLSMFCNDSLCNKETWWQTNYATVYFEDQSFITEKEYTCKNCGNNVFRYLFIWQEKNKGSAGLFVTVGQYPPLAIEPLPELAKALGEEDAALYKKALIDANFNHGLGAVAYFRRVLENKINLLLDLIAEAARLAQVNEEQLKELEQVKAGRAVERRIEYAAKILPAHLRPGGHNPLDKLYAMASAGLHGESDDDCLTIFAEAKFAFEYLFKNLTASNEEAREYAEWLSSQSPAKASKATVAAVTPDKKS